jgi:hypothetical protein
MTTIVGDWNKKILVSDSQFSDEDTGIKYFDEKVSSKSQPISKEKQAHIKTVQNILKSSKKQKSK